MKSSSTCRDAPARRSLSGPGSLVLLTIACVAGAVAGPRAMDPERALSQYMREAWATERGFPGGAVHAITQTPDGYLWIGTEKGLVRFDGISFMLVEPPPPASQAASPALSAVLGLITDHEGRLWLRLPGSGPLRYRAGQLEHVPVVAEPSGSVTTAMCRGTDGSVIVSGLVSGTRRFRQERVQALLASNALPAASIVIALAEMADGRLWVGTRDAGLFALRDGRLSSMVEGLPDRKVNCLAPIDGQQVWIGTDNGVARWTGTTITTAGVPPALARVQALAMLRDRAANVWVGTAAHGLVRVGADGTAAFDSAERRASGPGAEAGAGAGTGPTAAPPGTTVSSRSSGAALGTGAVTALFEDREGNLWIGHARGIERLRDSAFVTYGAAEGLPESSGPVYADALHRTWFAPSAGGLSFLRNAGAGGVVSVAADGLDRDLVYSIAGRAQGGDVWIGRQRGGLTRLRETGSGTFAAQSFTQADGLAQNSVFAVHQARDGAVWAGTLSGGVSRFTAGRFVTYTVAQGLAANTVTSIAESGDGTIWVGTPNGLSALSNGRWRTYTMRDGLPSDNITALLADAPGQTDGDASAGAASRAADAGGAGGANGAGMLWIGTSEGSVVLDAGQIHPLRDVPAALREPTVGLAADRRGSIWIATSRRVLRVSSAALLRGNLGEAEIREYGLADGLHGVEGVKRHRSVIADPQGRIWLSMNRGLSMVDPRRQTSAAPAIVHVQNVLVDGVSIAREGTSDLEQARTAAPVHVPPGRQRIAFTYAGVSLSVPERVRYRYRLEGFDREWSAPAPAREAVYTNLGPGSYQFRVIASNGDGLWNGVEARVGLQIAPAFWQTWWFRLSALMAGALAVAALYRIRLHGVTRRLHMRFEERLAERTRIAQELHDTLLQGFLSASMQLHVAVDRLPADSPAKPPLTRVLALMKQVIDEGRNALRGLRSTESAADDLEQALSRVPQQLALPGDRAFSVVVEGPTQPLPRVIRDEVYRIGHEALVNAFRHSGATTIEVVLEYGASQLRLLVRDDGRGIDPDVLRAGREGHWGLSGMRERAERIGARLTVWSRIGAGTEVELSVPGHVAFPSNTRHRWFHRLIGR